VILLPARERPIARPTVRRIAVGDRVRIERDETRYPSRGTWPQFRGRTATVVEINLGEYGVIFGSTRERPDRSSVSAADGRAVTTWFLARELVHVARASSSHADGPSGQPNRKGSLT